MHSTGAPALTHFWLLPSFPVDRHPARRSYPPSASPSPQHLSLSTSAGSTCGYSFSPARSRQLKHPLSLARKADGPIRITGPGVRGWQSPSVGVTWAQRSAGISWNAKAGASGRKGSNSRFFPAR